MAFTSSITNVDFTKSRRLVKGSYASSGGSTGGDVTTGLATVESFAIVPYGSSVATNQSVVNETFPLNNAGGVVTIVTDANQTGVWTAMGL